MALMYSVPVTACAEAVGIQHGLQLTAMAGGILAGFGLCGPWLQLKPSLPCTLMGKQIGRSEVRELGLQFIGGGVPPRFVRAALTPLPQSAPFAPLGLHQEKGVAFCCGFGAGQHRLQPTAMAGAF